MGNVAPEITEADLLNAGRIAIELGHRKEGYLDPFNASVCADGALRLATYEMLIGSSESTFSFDSIFIATDEVPKDVLFERYQAAVDALIPLLPDRCTDPTHLMTETVLGRRIYRCQAEDDGSLEWVSRIHHFNDFVCTGGADIALLFEQAAEKVRANA
jgi:hypothetical protein